MLSINGMNSVVRISPTYHFCMGLEAIPLGRVLKFSSCSLADAPQTMREICPCVLPAECNYAPNQLDELRSLPDQWTRSVIHLEVNVLLLVFLAHSQCKTNTYTLVLGKSITRQPQYLYSNIQKRSRKHCCCEEAKNINYYKCLSVFILQLFDMQISSSLHDIILSPVACLALQFFPHINS